MSDPESPPAKPSTSTSYLVVSACVAAIILGLALFLLVRGFQWRGAMADLRAEPGIEIMQIERAGFFKKRLYGLRDPLAPSVESILAKRSIGPHAADIAFVPYHSLNTVYAEERQADQMAQISAVKTELMNSISEFADRLEKKREADMEKMTQMLFEARFPKAMKNARVEWKDGQWHLNGELYAPEHDDLVANAADYLVEGQLNLGGLVNLTETRITSLREDIESADLFHTDLDGEFTHLDRVKRLVADYDEVCQRSNLAEPKLLLRATTSNRSEAASKMESLREALVADHSIAADRILPQPAWEVQSDAETTASIKLVAY